MPRLLEVCCGTAQVSRFFAAQGWEVVTVDWEAKWNPTILADVRSLKPEQLWTPGGFDVIWCSPDCTEFSLAKSTAPRDFAKGDSIVIACFDIIRDLTSNTDKLVFWAV
jgi:site-specific DNA-cytosine methylase